MSSHPKPVAAEEAAPAEAASEGNPQAAAEMKEKLSLERELSAVERFLSNYYVANICILERRPDDLPITLERLEVALGQGRGGVYGLG